MKIRGYYLPPQIKVREHTTLTFERIFQPDGRVEVEVPVLTPDLIFTITDHLLAFYDRVLVKKPVLRILKAIDQTIRRWQNPHDRRRESALKALPAITGFSPEMIARILERPWAEYRSNKIKAFLEKSIFNCLALDEFKKRSEWKSRAFGPRLTTHILAGNIPGVGIPDLILAASVKSANLVKTSSAEPLLPVLFAESLAEIDPELAHGWAVVWWRGGDQAIEQAAFSRSDCVIASGSEETIKTLQQQATSRFIGYGHRLSFGLIGKEVLRHAKPLARRAALDMAMYDQQGCLSPHLFYVETGGGVSPREFARLLADELEVLSIELPRGAVSTAAASTLRQLKDLTEMREASGEETAVFCGHRELDWLVIYEADPSFVPSPLHRVIRVKPLKDFSLLPSMLRTWTPYLQAAGVAVGKSRLKKVAESLGRLGVNRICPIGKMQEPPIGWHQDGRSALMEMVRWVGLEE
jgi:Acyl-CoA reductase (LuxC)